MPKSSTYEAEVVVIGAGLAGMVTALELLDAGKRVVVLDAASRDRFGGLALWSFGGMFFVDSPEQRKNGIKDSVDLAMRDWVRYGELDPADVWPYRWAEAYVNRCTEEVRGWLAERGVSFFGKGVNWTERGYFVPGNSVPRFHIVWGTGEGIVLPLIPGLEAHEKAGRLQLHFDHRVDGLTQEGGQVVGCHGAHGAGEFEARGDAVVIAAGGIAGNHDKVREVWPRDQWGEPPDPPLVGSYDTLLLVDRICREEKKYSWQVMNRKIANKEFAVSGAEFNQAVRDKKLLTFFVRMLQGNGEQVQEFIDHCPDFVTARSVAELADKSLARTNALSAPRATRHND